MKVEVYIVNSFAKTGRGGNPAGVVLNADKLKDNDMQKIARKVGLSETAFVQKSSKADFKIRFFTPSSEVNLCGHATLATFFLLFHNKIIKKGKYRQETKAGVLDIHINKKGEIFMNQNLPVYSEIIGIDEITNSLNISREIINSELPIQIVSTGLRDIFIPIRRLKDLFKIKPKFSEVSRISRKYNVMGYHLFTLETKSNSIAYCRNLAPLYDIPEESATGTSNGALSCYLLKYGKLDKKKLNNLIFEQGYSMGKPSEILVKLKIKKSIIEEVRVGGRAIISKSLKISF